jgi:hypothetical protein
MELQTIMPYKSIGNTPSAKGTNIDKTSKTGTGLAISTTQANNQIAYCLQYSMYNLPWPVYY